MSDAPGPDASAAGIAAIGLDIGGTKIEVQAFAPDWSVRGRQRVPTPRDYPGLLAAIADLVAGADPGRDPDLPIGICSAGVSDPVSGRFVAANLPASGHGFHADLERALGADVMLVNDARAFALSEAVFGAARHARVVAGVILGTGIGGGIVIDKRLHGGARDLAGEFGHGAAPAHIVAAHGLPLVPCRCGRTGCIETLASGPGLSRLCAAMTGTRVEPARIAALRASSPDIAAVWRVWCALVAELLLHITLCAEPEVFVLGGGLSRIPGICEDLSAALENAHFLRGAAPAIVLAEGGDASGARGAAYAATRAHAAPQRSM